MTVSVLIDTCNHGAWLDQAVASVLAQRDVDFAALELVVVDDGSRDDTPARLARYGSRLRVLHKPNGGQASAFNHALPQLNGDIVALLDGDDTWHPDKLRTVLDAFAADAALVAVGHGIVEVTTATGRRQTVVPRGARRLDLRDAAAAQQFVRHRAFLGTSRLAARREPLLACLPVPTTLRYEADEWLFTLLAAQGPVAVLPAALTDYRLHGGNLYQVALPAGDARLVQRADVFRCLRDRLPAALANRGVPAPAIAAVIDPLDMEAMRLDLLLGRGSRTKAARLERRLNVAQFTDARGGYRLFRAAMPVLAWLLPPPLMHRLRQAYGRSPWRRLRERLLRGGPDESVDRLS